jgi:hypothetical protein
MPVPFADRLVVEEGLENLAAQAVRDARSRCRGPGCRHSGRSPPRPARQLLPAGGELGGGFGPQDDAPVRNAALLDGVAGVEGAGS